MRAVSCFFRQRVAGLLGLLVCLGAPAAWSADLTPIDTASVETAAQTFKLEPRIEPIAKKPPNRPYTVLGQRYEPLVDDVPFKQRGLSSWYGMPFHGRRTASGETFDMHALTAAHPTLPIPSYVKVRHVRNGKEVIVRINDRGPFHSARILDLSRAAAQQLGLLGQGTAEVEIERLTFDDIRTGRWRQGDEQVMAVADAAPQGEDPMQAMIEMSLNPVDDASSVAPVQAEAPAPVATPYWVQLGAFEQADGADNFRQRMRHELQELGEMLAVFRAGSLTHLQLGPFAGPVEAGQVAQRVRAVLQLVPIIVQRP